jgi:hypothetical protein
MSPTIVSGVEDPELAERLAEAEVLLPSSSACGVSDEPSAMQVLLEVEGRGARVVLAAQVLREVGDHRELREVVS